MSHRVAMRSGGLPGVVHVVPESVEFFEGLGFRRVDDSRPAVVAEDVKEAKSDGVRKSGGRRRSARTAAE